MLIRLLRTYLTPYRGELTGVVVLQFISTMAALYLPSLNADIIDNGVTKGDTGYILSTGGMMLMVTLTQILCSVGAVFFGARVAMGRRTRSPGFGAASGRDVFGPRGRALTVRLR